MGDCNQTQLFTPRERWFYLLFLALALGTRIVFVASADGNSLYTRWSTATDAGVYDRFGWNLVSDGVLGVGDRPSAFALPAYPLLVAGAYRLAGHKPGAVRWVQVGLSVLTVVFLGRLARCLGGARSEILVIAGGACYPFFIYFTREILTETLFLFSFSGMMLTAARLGRAAKLRDGALHGVFVTLAVLTRPAGLVVEPGVLLLTRPWAREDRGRRTLALLLALLILAVFWGSWIARNRAVFGETVLLDTHGGFALYAGQLISRGLSAEEAFKRVGYHHGDIEKGRLPDGPRGELEADRRAGQRARETIREDPKGFLLTLPRNVAVLWLGLDFSDVSSKGGRLGVMTLVGWLSYGPILLLGLAGLWRTYRIGRLEQLAAFASILLLTTLLHAVVLGGKRYRTATIDPVLLVLAAWESDSRLKPRQSRSGN